MSIRNPAANTSIDEPRDREFHLLSRLVYQHSGISLGEHKRSLLRSRLRKRLVALELASFGDYYNYLIEQDSDGSEMVLMLNAISTNFTEFFREPGHFDYLRETFFARWMKEPCIRILSAGCSTGEEPYSIAVMAQQVLGPAATQKVKICAVDLSTQALARARAGVYTLEQTRAMTTATLRTFFLQGTGDSAGLVKVNPDTQSMVSFQRGNITQAIPFSGPFHAVFCRNVAIYFDAETRAELFGRLFQLLLPRGNFFLGHSESMLATNQAFSYIRPTIYERGVS